MYLRTVHLSFSQKKKIELRKPEKSNWQSCFLKFKPLNCNIRGSPLLHWGTILHLRRQASHLLCFKVKAALQSCRKLTYEAGDKCGKLLARVLQVKRYGFLYTSYTEDRQAKSMFAQGHCAQVWGLLLLPLQPFNLSPSAIEAYLSSAHLSSPVCRELEAPITIKELQAAVRAVKLGKAPGPDGFTIQYYTTLMPLLGPRMLKVFNALGQSTSFPPATLLAHISVIPKEGKHPTVCGSYRLIS